MSIARTTGERTVFTGIRGRKAPQQTWLVLIATVGTVCKTVFNTAAMSNADAQVLTAIIGVLAFMRLPST